MALQFDVATRNATLDALTAQVGASATLRIYSGTAPADVATAATGTLLYSGDCSATAFAPAAASGVLSPTQPVDKAAAATGTAGYWRVYTSGGVAKIQGTVGTSGADMTLNTLSLQSGGNVDITGWTITAAGA